MSLTLLHSERPKLHAILVFLSAKWSKIKVSCRNSVKFSSTYSNHDKL